MTITSKEVSKTKTMEEKAEVLVAEEEVIAPAPVKATSKKVQNKNKDGKILMFMERENFSWKTPGGVIFTREHPYQIVAEEEVPVLLPEGFREASAEEVKKYYQGG